MVTRRYWTTDSDDGTDATDDAPTHPIPDEEDCVPEVLLIDLSSLFHPIYHMSATEPDPDHASTATVSRVHALAAHHAHVAVCCDGPKNWRREVDPTYKANRPARDEILTHQIHLAEAQLARDGFPVWTCEGYEADDLIGTAVRLVRERNAAHTDPDARVDVLIASSDKDLLQLVAPGVRVKSFRDGAVYDAAAVKAKFGVYPDQIVDYLSLVGDASDNVKGAKGVGPAKAVALLEGGQTLDTIYTSLEQGSLVITPGLTASLREFKDRWPMVANLIGLLTDAPIPFHTLFETRESEAAKTFAEDAMSDEPEKTLVDNLTGLLTEMTGVSPTPEAGPDVKGHPVQPGPLPTEAVVTALEVLPAPAADYALQLDPRSMTQAKQLAVDMHHSRMFTAYGSPQAVLATVMVGRELGLPAMASLRMIHNIEGKHSLSAQLVVALVLKSGLAEYFRPIEISDTKVTFETKRKGKGNTPVRLTHTIEMAQQAGLVKEKSGWVKNPTDMLVARCQVRLARLVYPDVSGGLYTPEELADAREASHE